MGSKWTCPYCNRPCTVGKDDVRTMGTREYIAPEYGWYYSKTTVVVCPNPDCRKKTISQAIHKWDSSRERIDDVLFSWQLLPESAARPFPDYIPEQLREDYAEACLIRDKSPKASATLSRRCLQGMIRDFWNIKKGRLVDEIEALQDKVDSATWQAIDSVRHVGNIGAHMEKDVNLIIDVEPEEAGLLIWLIETLFQEWYIARHEREERMKKLVLVASEKINAKKAPGSAPVSVAAPLKTS